MKGMKKVLSYLFPVKVKYCRTWLALSWQSFILSVKIWPNQFVMGLAAGVLSVILLAAIGWSFTQPTILFSNEIYAHTGEKVPVALIDWKGNKFAPTSPEAKYVLKAHLGHYEFGWAV